MCANAWMTQHWAVVTIVTNKVDVFQWNFNPIYSLKQLQRICDFWKIVIHKKMLLVIYLLLIYLHVYLPFGLKTLCLWIQSHMSHEAVWGLRYSTQQICQNFPIIPFFWNFHIFLYEMNPIEHWNTIQFQFNLFHSNLYIICPNIYNIHGTRRLWHRLWILDIKMHNLVRTLYSAVVINSENL
mgnify:CR=1 FL=1